MDLHDSRINNNNAEPQLLWISAKNFTIFGEVAKKIGVRRTIIAFRKRSTEFIYLDPDYIKAIEAAFS